jgi:hypothetical protein
MVDGSTPNVLGKNRLTRATIPIPEIPSATPLTIAEAGTSLATRIAIASTATYNETWSNWPNARPRSDAQLIEIRVQIAKSASRPSATTATLSTRARAAAIPIAAPVPSTHHAEMAAYDFVVVSKPPFA